MSGANIKTVSFETGAREWLDWVKQRVKPTSYAQYTVKLEKNILPYLGQLKWKELTGEQIKGLEKRLLEEGLTPQYTYDNLVQTKMITKYVSRVYGCPDPGLDVVLEKPGKSRAGLNGQGWTGQSVQGWNAQDRAVPDGGLRKQAAGGQGQTLSSSEFQGEGSCLLEEPRAGRAAGELLYDRSMCEKLCQVLTQSPNPTKAGILLTLFTGLRIGELCALRWRDFDLEEGLLTVRQTLQRISAGENTGLVLTDLKGEPGERVLPLAPFLREVLEGMRRDESCFFLSGKETPVEPRTLQYRLRALLKSEGLPDVNFSGLRRLFISRCLSSGVDLVTVTDLLGNATVQSTLNGCPRPSLQNKVEAISLIAGKVNQISLARVNMTGS